MAKTLLGWIPIIVWAVLFEILDGFHILSTRFNLFLILLLGSSCILVLIYKYLLNDTLDSGRDESAVT
jgi:hypothetical protein